jgi:hypothetical protein
MLQRHKVPTIFNIYMLDVICCALGCVILLWQVAHQEAETQTAAAKTKGDEAVQAKQDYEKSKHDLLLASNDVSGLQSTLLDWQKKHDALAQSLAQTEKQRDASIKLAADRLRDLDKTSDSLSLTKAERDKLQTDLAKWLAIQEKTSKELVGTQKANTDLLAKLVLSEKQIASLKTDIRTKILEFEDASKKTSDQAALLKVSQEDARKLQKLLDTLQNENKDAKTKLQLTELQLKVREQDLDRAKKDLQVLLTSKDKLNQDLVAVGKERIEAKGTIESLSKELAAANAMIGTLRLDKKNLAQQIASLETDVEQRFAGIPLTGENVLFLIDISGSMMMKDTDTEDPDKWPFLCETMMKLMKSIPTLQRFQVLLFSDKVTYLYDHPGKWLKYEGPKTAVQLRADLRKVKVEGNTNMHDALAEAFRFRKLKLDTIYLISDGLPNAGPGLPPSNTRLTEAEKNLYLSKHVRDKLKNVWNAPQDGMKEVRINAVGFFFESPDVGAFLWAMAREHNGSFVGLK